MMGYPKQMIRKKRVQRRKSILQDAGKDVCFLCVLLHGDERQKSVLHTHHVFGGTANRKLSERYGLTVKLCPEHHTLGPEAVHKNSEMAKILHACGQTAFESHYPDLAFREIFGRDYR